MQTELRFNRNGGPFSEGPASKSSRTIELADLPVRLLHEGLCCLVLSADHDARRKGAGTPVLRRSMKCGIRSHLPMCNEIVQGSERALDFLQMLQTEFA
jgi:hypothetical protein